LREQLFAVLARAAEKNAPSKRPGALNAQGLANIVWAFAVAGRSDELLFRVAARMAIQLLAELNVQDVANIV